MSKSAPGKPSQKSRSLTEQGLAHYANWELGEAIDCLFNAAKLAPNDPESHLNLARALARAGSYDLASESISTFLQCEPTGPVASRFRQIDAGVLDATETYLTETMKSSGAPLEDIGAALKMWLEFRITAGRDPIASTAPNAWAAALDYTVQKVNFRDTDVEAIASRYGTTAATVRKRHQQVIQTLDIMPCDYRYFVGQENPLDKLVEAATMLEEIERRFTEY